VIVFLEPSGYDEHQLLKRATFMSYWENRVWINTSIDRHTYYKLKHINYLSEEYGEDGDPHELIIVKVNPMVPDIVINYGYLEKYDLIERKVLKNS
jgi:hypothetical protein